MINIYRDEKRSYIFILFFFFEKKDQSTMSFMTPCIIYFSIMGFMQSKELQHLSFLEYSLC